MTKGKMGRPKLPENEKAKVLSFLASPELHQEIDEVLQYTGGTISDYLRAAVSYYTQAALLEYKNQAITDGILRKYTGGQVEP